MARAYGGAPDKFMKAFVVPAAEAQMILRELQEGCNRGVRQPREINVSFRDKNGAIGRRDFATHWIHRYPAKMFHRIPSEFLDAVNLPSSGIILDPFCGSGTVLLEANLRGHDAIGIDINPLARLISRVKTKPIDPKELSEHLLPLLTRAKRSRSIPPPQSILDSWIPRPARVGLHRLSIAITQLTDNDLQSFFRVALTSIARAVSLADPAIPPLVRLRKERIDRAGPRYRKAFLSAQTITTSYVYASFSTAATANIRRMSELYALRGKLGSSRITEHSTEAAHTGLPPESVDAIITSPPYCGSQKYVRCMKLELILSGCQEDELRQLDRSTLGTEAVTTRFTRLDELLTSDEYADSLIRKVYSANPVRARMASDYSKYLYTFAAECGRVLRPGGHLLVILGRSTLAGYPYPADRIFCRAGQEAGLEPIATLVDPIPSRGLITRRHSTARLIDSEYILWMQRPR